MSGSVQERENIRVGDYKPTTNDNRFYTQRS